jgi:hypothetical protein
MCTDFLINMGICFEIFGNITFIGNNNGNFIY